MDRWESILESNIQTLSLLNPGYWKNRQITNRARNGVLQKVLIANRGEIAKRFFLSLREEGIPSVAIVTDVDLGQSWYEFADEFVRIGDVSNYTNIDLVVSAAIFSKSNAIYPGYGFLSENPIFVKRIKEFSQFSETGLIFMGPDDSVMERVGEKLAARALAKQNGVPLFEGSESIRDLTHAKEIAAQIGYPVIVKLSSGGGGKGMMPVFQESELFFAIESSKRIGRSLYNDETFYLEKYITKPVHIEVQIFNGTAIGLRKCAVQRRNQKVIEETGDFFLDDTTILSLLAAAENMAKISGYSNGCGAGTVEFLYDQSTGNIGFLEMNTRLQVEHPVTDQSLGIDLAKWQILQFDGRASEIHFRDVLEKRFIRKDHAIECRIYAEDPESNYTPSPGKIEELELPTFNGTRCDFGFKKGDSILPDYDPMIGKIITRGATRSIAITRMERALSELYIKGITTNINQLLHIIRDPAFIQGDYTNRILDENKHLEKPIVSEGDAVLASVFSSVCECSNYIKKLAIDSFNKKDIEFSVTEQASKKLPSEFRIETESYANEITLYQSGIDTFHILLNGSHIGEAKIESRTESQDEYLIRFGLRSYNIRIETRANYTLVRIKNLYGKIVYIRVKITIKGIGREEDEIGTVRSPFQGTFVKFCKDERSKRDRLSIGSYVKKEDPVVIISAMKMETVVTAPVTGYIKYLIEDGDLSKLQVGTTPQGQIIGKNIPEGEILFKIKPDDKSEANNKERTIKPKSSFKLEKPVSNVSKFIEALVSEEESLPGEPDIVLSLEAIKSHLLGLSVNDLMIEKVLRLLEDFEIQITDSNYNEIERNIYDVLFLIYLLKRLYAPSTTRNISLFNELNVYLSHITDENFEYSIDFKYIMENLLEFYSVKKWSGVNQNQILDLAVALLYIQRAYHQINNRREILNIILKYTEALLNFRKNKKLLNLLKKVYIIEESERDPSYSYRILQILEKNNLPQPNKIQMKTISRKYFREFKLLVNSPEKLYLERFGIEFNSKNFLESLQKAKIFVPDKNDPFHRKIQAKLENLNSPFTIINLFSPKKELVCLRLKQEDSGKSKYLIFNNITKLDSEYDMHGNITGSPNAENGTIDSALLLKLYMNLDPSSNNQIELIADLEPTIVDLGSLDHSIFNLDNLLMVNFSVNHFLKDLSVKRMIVNLLCQSPLDGSIANKMFELTVENGLVVADLIIPEDTKNLYSTRGADTATLRLLEKNKWPAEFWSGECFQRSSLREIKINLIDNLKRINPKTGKEEIYPVGSKLFIGIMGSTHCLFYFKDSRINGGATGNYEGLKYIAALFLSFKLNVPVYIWNDGAGANIREGMISLNRAGQGFMMNTLLTYPWNEEKFNKFTYQNPDPTLQKLFSEIDKTVLPELTDIRKSISAVIAVGVGSSTGLDVYGSSQAAIQIMLDSEESYRVLTGSNVIKSVMGEDFTNYQIGGAPVMSKWTGTVDIVAKSKLELIPILRLIQYLLTDEKIKRKNPVHKEPQLSPGEICNEEIIKQNLDDEIFIPFKEDYYGSASLIGGFGKLNSRGICIMATRNNFGIRSFQTVTRAKELSIISRKLGFDRVLLFGNHWFYQNLKQDSQTLQARKDFLVQYRSEHLMNIHIISEIHGLEKAPINSLADLILFVKNRNYEPEEIAFIQKSSTFIIESFNEAFDLTRKILLYKNTILGDSMDSSHAEKFPDLPKETAQSFDMLESVIHRVFDENSFIEFFKDMNDPMHGPSLITGLAKLNGKTVGVLADQPKIIGGAPDAPGTEKFRIFTNFVNKFHIPIVMLSNAPGFLPGTKQERLRIQQIGAESLDSNISGEVPVVSLVLNQNYGGRQIHAFSKSLRPGIVYMALDSSIMAVMGSSASFDLFFGKKYNQLLSEGKTQEAIQLKEEYVQEYNRKSVASNDAYKTGILDYLIQDTKEIRKYLILGIEKAIEEADRFFNWKTKLQNV